jgi:hypothetical protein
MTIATSQRKAGEVDVELRNLQRLAIATRQLEKEIPQLELSLAGARQERDRLAARAEKVLTRLGKVRSRREAAVTGLDALRKRRAGLAARLEELQGARSAAEQTVRALDEELRKALEEMPGVDSDALEKVDAEEIRARVAALEEEHERLAKEAGEARRRAEELAGRLPELRARKAALEREIAELRAATLAEIPLKDPARRRDYSKTPVWVECYAAPSARRKAEPDASAAPPEEAGGRPVRRVRLVNTANYVRDGKLLRPVKPGETLAELVRPGSRFLSFLREQDESSRRDRFVYFVVRPDAYAAFHAAARLAREAGWEVLWDPIEAGSSLAVGRGAG